MADSTGVKREELDESNARDAAAGHHDRSAPGPIAVMRERDEMFASVLGGAALAVVPSLAARR